MRSIEEKRTASDPVTILGVFRIIPAKQKATLLAGMGLRTLTNFFDLFALAGVGLLAIVVSKISTDTGVTPIIQVPLIGAVAVDEKTTVLVAFGIASLFLMKSVSSILLNSWIGKTIAKIEGQAAKDVLLKTFIGKDLNSKISSISELQNLLTTSLGALFSNLLTSVVTLVAEISLLVILIAGFIIVSPIATAGMIIYLGLVILGLNFFVAHRIKKESAVGYLALEQTLKRTRDMFVINKEAHLDGNTDEWINRISSSKLNASLSMVRGLNLNGVPRYVIETSLIFGIFVFMAVVLLFGSLASQAIVIGIFLTGGLRLVAAMLPLQAAMNSFRHSTVAGRQAFEILSQPKDVSADNRNYKLKDFNSDQLIVTVEKLKYSHTENEPLFENVSFEIQKGIKFAIVGPSGSGKTTLFDLLMGFITPKNGSIEILGLSPEMIISKFPGLIGYVPQKPMLISGTLKENITLSFSAEAQPSDKELREAIQIAGLTNVVANMPDGLETIIEPDSAALSGGEIQRLGLARAVLGKPKLLFLDEATSALDAKTENNLNISLNKLKGEVTVVVIAHRLSTVQDADQILYLDKGKILSQGKFQELINSLPEFREAVSLMSLNDSGVES